MKKNKVVLDLEDYNNLRDFKKEIEKNHVVCFETLFSGIQKVYTMNEAVKTLANVNYMLTKDIKDQLSDMKSYGWWKFRKWKRGEL